jgi:hypothetical protein
MFPGLLRKSFKKRFEFSFFWVERIKEAPQLGSESVPNELDGYQRGYLYSSQNSFLLK